MPKPRHFFRRSLAIESLEERIMLFNGLGHAEINKDAFALDANHSFLRPAVLSTITLFDNNVDRFTLGGILPGTAYKHVDDSQFKEAVEFVNSKLADAVAQACNGHFTRAAISFGKLLHTIQDLASH